jgi:hypothetical protein
MPRHDRRDPDVVYYSFHKIPAEDLPAHTVNQISVCLSTDWIPVIVGMIKALTHGWAWSGSDEARLFAKSEALLLIEDLENVCMDCCVDVAASAELAASSLLSAWDGTSTLQEINPNIPDDTWSHSTGDSDATARLRRVALCNGCKIFIDYLCRLITEYVNQAGNLFYIISGIGTIASLIAVAFLGPAAAVVLAVALVAGLGSVGVNALDFWTSTICDNEDIKWQAACYLYNYLKNISITQGNLQAALDAGGNPIGDDWQKILEGGSLVTNANTKHVFEAFVNAVGEANRAALIGLLVDCPCFGEWCRDEDFTAVESFDIISGRGSWVASVGYECVDYFQEPYWYRACQIRYTFDAPAIVTQVTFQYNADLDDGDVREGDNTYINLYRDGSEIVVEGAATADGNGHFMGWNGNETVDAIEFVLIVSTRATHTNGGSGAILNMEARGEEENPFAGGDNCD